jgi:pimeloyl-ACP methyl ester carboxylesterase
MNKTTKTRIVALLVALVLAGVQGIPAVQAYEQEYQGQGQAQVYKMSSITMNIEFRPGVTADINVAIYENPAADRKGSGVIKGKVGYTGAGFAHSGASYEPLISALFAKDRDISMIFVPDLPGHGNSSIPKGMLFGDLTLQDYANIDRLILDGLTKNEELRKHGISIDFAIFHSQHGLTAAMTQEQVNLKKYGIKDVILIAPAPPQQVNWSFLNRLDPGSFLPYLKMDEKGMYFSMPVRDWVGFFFSNPDGSISVNSGIPFENIGRYDADAPITSTLQLVGVEVNSFNPPVFGANNSLRPYVSEGVFRNGPKLWIVAYGNDTIVSKQDIEKTNEILTGKKNGNKNIITIPGAVHDYHLTASGSVEVAKTINKILKRG